MARPPPGPPTQGGAMVHFLASFVMLLLLAGAAIADAQPAASVGSRPLPQIIPGQFIVELHPGESQDALIRAHGLVTSQRWQLVNAFVAHMPEAAANQLRADARVKRVAPDVVITAFPKPPGGGGGKGGGKPGGSVPPGPCPDPTAAKSVAAIVPTGVQRIGATAAPTGDATGVNVAIIDTGIDDCHPDLRVLGGTNIVDSTKSPRDDNGHGTHVAGIVGALANGYGVVGVAPGAALWAVKVLDASGSGALSNIVGALDWAARNHMQVANLSLGAQDLWCALFGLCGEGTECTAISNAVARGITVVVAAGNSADEALFYTPANCRDSLTVSAFVDLDGAVGGSGSVTINGQTEFDDTFAQSFSNHSEFIWDVNGDGTIGVGDHPVIDFMAPGVSIVSTLPTYTVTLTTQYGLPLNYGSLSGTSMATPHVAGAVTRYLAAHPGTSPDSVRQALLQIGECPGSTTPVTFGGLLCSTQWPDDPDPDPSEPLVHVLGF